MVIFVINNKRELACVNSTEFFCNNTVTVCNKHHPLLYHFNKTKISFLVHWYWTQTEKYECKDMIEYLWIKRNKFSRHGKARCCSTNTFVIKLPIKSSSSEFLLKELMLLSGYDLICGQNFISIEDNSNFEVLK